LQPKWNLHGELKNIISWLVFKRMFMLSRALRPPRLCVSVGRAESLNLSYRFWPLGLPRRPLPTPSATFSYDPGCDPALCWFQNDSNWLAIRRSTAIRIISLSSIGYLIFMYLLLNTWTC
jgi:hypothetical protein